MKQTKLEKELEEIVRNCFGGHEDTESDIKIFTDKLLALFEKYIPKKKYLDAPENSYLQGRNEAIDDMKKALKGE